MIFVLRHSYPASARSDSPTFPAHLERLQQRQDLRYLISDTHLIKFQSRDSALGWIPPFRNKWVNAETLVSSATMTTSARQTCDHRLVSRVGKPECLRGNQTPRLPSKLIVKYFLPWFSFPLHWSLRFSVQRQRQSRRRPHGRLGWRSLNYS